MSNLPSQQVPPKATVSDYLLDDLFASRTHVQNPEVATQLADSTTVVSNYRKRVQELLDVVKDTFDLRIDDPALPAKISMMCAIDEELPRMFEALRPQVIRASMLATEAHETFLKYRPLVERACKSDLAKPKSF